MSLYADYLQERTEDKIMESDVGFLTYRFYKDLREQCDAVYIVDLYVKPEYRKDKLASAMADNVVSIAKKRGCKKLLGSVVTTNKDATTSLRVLLSYGMMLDYVTENMIFFRKDI